MNLARVGALALLMFSNLGCMLAGAVAAKTVGETVQAEYIPRQEPLLVLAESYRGSPGITLDADQLAAYVTDEFNKHQIAPTISPTAAMDLRAKDPATYRKLKISQIGLLVGAKQVLYIHLLESGAEQTGTAEIIRANVSVRVKIVDAQTGETRWPDDAIDGYPLSAQSPMVKTGDGASESSLRQGLQQNLAVQIGRLFRKYQRDE